VSTSPIERASRASRPRRIVRRSVAALVLVATACSSGSDVRVADPIPETDEAEASVVTVDVQPGTGTGIVAATQLVADAAEELDRIRFTDIDTSADLDQLELFMHAAGAQPIPLLLYLDAEGLYSVVPLHPTNPGGGGDVQLQLHDGADRSAPMALALSGIPEADGAWNQTLIDVMTELGGRAEAMGSSLEEIRLTPPDQLDDELAVLKLVAGMIDDGTDADLLSLPERAADGWTDRDRQVLDAVVAKMEVQSLIPRARGLEPATFAAAGFGEGRAVGRPVGQQGSVTGGASSIAAPETTCRPSGLVIENAAQLVEAVAEGRDASARRGEATRKLAQDVAALSGTLGDTPYAGPFLAAVQSLYATLDLWNQADAGRYPTQFVSLTANLSHTEFNEDFTMPGTVTGVNVIAASTGFNAADSFAIVATNLVNTLLGEVTGAAAAESVTDWADEVAVDAGSQLRETVTNQLIQEFGDRYLAFCPEQWSVDITDPTYTKVSGVIGRITADESAMTYQPADVGDDVVRVEARPDVFSGVTAFQDTPVTTKTLQVDATPSDVLVATPGDVVEITGEAVQADTPSLAWDAGAGSWQDGLPDETEGSATRPLLTPTNPSDYPFVVTIRSASTTGLRAESTEERLDTVTVRLQGLFVEPDPGSVLVEKTLGFTATDREGRPREVTWTATGGTIDASGVYSAGPDEGSFTVTATAVDDPSTTVTVTVNVVDAVCLVGTWRIRSQEFFDGLSASVAELGAITFRSGEYRIVIREDGSFSGIRDAWTFAVSAPEGNVVVTITAEDGGTWSASDTTLTVNDIAGPSTVTGGIEAGGQFIPLPGGAVQVPPGAGVSGSGPFTCSGDVLTVEVNGFTTTMDRISTP
jgi:hypothetical protein